MLATVSTTVFAEQLLDRFGVIEVLDFVLLILCSAPVSPTEGRSATDL
jgi:hypothetical protein